MSIWDEGKLILFIAFVVPGFIAIKAYELLSPSKHIDSSKQIIDAVAYSCLNYALLLWPIFLVESGTTRGESPNLYILFYVFVLFIAPIIWVLIWKYLRQWECIQRIVPHPTQKPWDFVFAQRYCYWIIVTLKSGKKVAGMYGTSSFASSAPSAEQIFLEEEWLLNDDGGFDRPVEQSSGVIILSTEIETVEIFHNGENGNE